MPLAARVARHALLLLAFGSPAALPSQAPSAPRAAAQRPDSLLAVPLAQTAAARARFAERWRRGDRFRARPLYEAYLDSIGANGIVSVLRSAAPSCHDEGHELGRAIYARLRDVNRAFRACDDACNSGCMHGVVTEFFAAAGARTDGAGAHAHHAPASATPPRIGAEDLRRAMSTVCNAPARGDMYLLGDCAHGVGHAAMFLTRLQVDSAVALCDLLGTHALRFYCATGAYMEYRLQRADADYATRGPFHPCDRAAYPAACFRYRLVSTFALHYRAGRRLSEIANGCLAMARRFRLGCFHGIGNAHMGVVAQGRVSIASVCRFGRAEDRQVCIEGVMERLGKFHPRVVSARCAPLAPAERAICTQSAARKMYDLERSFALYPR